MKTAFVIARHAVQTPQGSAVTPLAVQALGEDARDGRLADAPRAGEQEGMVYAALGQGVGQGLQGRAAAPPFR